MLIAGFLPESFVDWRGKIVATVFTHGCNFRCPFCHNYALVKEKPVTILAPENVLESIASMKDWIDGVCITGGEPTLHDDIVDFVKELSKIVPVKLDTNGTRPDILSSLLPYLEYVAMDVKAPPEKYKEMAGVAVNIATVEKSIKIIMTRAKDYEFRTTYVPLLKKEDIEKISRWIEGAKRYVIQQFSTNGGTLNPNFSAIKPHTKAYLIETCRSVESRFEECIIANV